MAVKTIPEQKNRKPRAVLATQDVPSRLQQAAIKKMTSQEDLLLFINRARRVSFSAVDDSIVDMGYPAAAWMLRSCMLTGNVKGAQACRIFIDWAKEVIARQEHEQKGEKERQVHSAFGLSERRSTGKSKTPIGRDEAGLHNTPSAPEDKSTTTGSEEQDSTETKISKRIGDALQAISQNLDRANGIG